MYINENGELAFTNLNGKASSPIFDINYSDFYREYFFAYRDSFNNPSSYGNVKFIISYFGYDKDYNLIKKYDESIDTGSSVGEGHNLRGLAIVSNINRIYNHAKEEDKVKYVKIEITNLAEMFNLKLHEAANKSINNYYYISYYVGSYSSSFWNENSNYVNINCSKIKKSTIKYAKGNHSIDYFKNNGEFLDSSINFDYLSWDEYIKVTENGIYTVYGEDEDGNKHVERIEITNIAN